jgi:hypothetical protein
MVPDWDLLAEQASASAQTTTTTPDILQRVASATELDTLLGWATHVTGPNAETVRTTTHEQESKHNNSPSLVGDTPPAPLRPSELQVLHKAMQDFIRSNSNKNSQSANNDSWPKLYHKFDVSALVAMGMVWQDMVTASLLPLAQQHVEHCRHRLSLSQDHHDETNNNTTTTLLPDVTTMWTLPPEEALVLLLSPWKERDDERDDYDTSSTKNNTYGKAGLPTATPATHVASTTVDTTSTTATTTTTPANEDEGATVQVPSVSAAEALARWTTSHGLSSTTTATTTTTATVHDNADIFTLLLGQQLVDALGTARTANQHNEEVDNVATMTPEDATGTEPME